MGTTISTLMRGAIALCLIGVIAGCSATYRNHGYIPDEIDLEAIVVGVDTRSSVEDSIGKPSTSGVLRDEAWYYMRERREAFAYRAPKTIERELLAISFAPDGTVSNIERFGLEDGQVVTLSRRVTETTIKDFGLIQQIIRNFGRINIGEALADG